MKDLTSITISPTQILIFGGYFERTKSYIFYSETNYIEEINDLPIKPIRFINSDPKRNEN